MLPKMRTIDEAIAEIKEADPRSAITKFNLRRSILDGTLPHIKAGRKILVNMAHIEDWLNPTNQEKESIL